MKKVLENTITGTVGEDTVGIAVQKKMGYIWRPTAGRYDVGYDGLIEVRDETSKEVKGLIIFVQSKSLQTFENEDDKSFVYRCTQDDYDYWMGSNVPDILVVSRSRTDELYWSPIKKYFSDNPKQRKDRKIIFNKLDNKFDETAKNDIALLAIPKDSGIYLPPVHKQESLYSNLIEVISYPETLYIAQTDFRDPRSLISALRERGEFGARQWILANKTIMSFSPMDNMIWDGLYLEGTLETFNSSEWAESDDESKLFEFSRLLNKSMGVKCYQLGLKYEGNDSYFYFDSDSQAIERKIKYKSIVQKTSRQVIKAYFDKRNPSKLVYYKHLAFSSRFLRFGNNWYLQINPTYHFTYDGKNKYQYYEKPLKGLKRLQKNKNVLGEVVCITEHLNLPITQNPNNEPIVQLGKLLTFDVTGGIEDSQWLTRESE